MVLTMVMVILLALLVLVFVPLFRRDTVTFPPTDIPAGVIDMHCHTAGTGAGGSGCFVSPRLQGSWRYHLYLRAFGVCEKDLLEIGDGLVIRRIAERLAGSRHVQRGVVLALDGVVGADGELDRSRTEMHVPNEFVAEEVKKYGNLLFGASINPYRHDALAGLDRVAVEGAVLMKWLPAIQLIDPADERIIPFYRRLRDLGLPLLVHTGAEHSFTIADNRFGDPERLRLPLELGVKVIAAHAATTGKSEGEDNMTRLLRMFPNYPNLYADISSLTQINKLFYLPRLLEHRDIYGRLLYGTDMPLITIGLVSPWFFAHRLSISRILALQREGNPWDKDVLLKSALGVPSVVFAQGNQVLRLQDRLEQQNGMPLAVNLQG